MTKPDVPVPVTVNLQGKTVELTQLGEDALSGRASYGKYAYAVGCERLFGLLDRHGIKATAFVPPARRRRQIPIMSPGSPTVGMKSPRTAGRRRRWTHSGSTNARCWSVRTPR